MKTRTSVLLVACLAVVGALVGSSVVAAGAGIPTTCQAKAWCTVTAYGVSSPEAAQYAIGNVPAGSVLGVTQYDAKHRQIGGEILGGVLRGTCAWSQYQRDWAPLVVAPPDSSCANPVHYTRDFVADDGRAIWTGCYPRCFGGVPLRFDRRCGKRNRTFCYSSNCEEYANFNPWSPAAHPADPLRMTHRHRLDIRYRTRYGDVWTNTPFYMVKDSAVAHGRGNWVFISGAACGVVAGPTGVYNHFPRHQ